MGIRRSASTTAAITAKISPPEPDAALRPSFLELAEWNAVVRELRLSPQQARIAALLLYGMMDKQIAISLKLSVSTVRMYLTRMFARLGVANRMELAIKIFTLTRRLGLRCHVIRNDDSENNVL
jgi:DNA-binding NarL/FixJ family response regulator